MGLFDKFKKGLQKTRNAFSGRMDELVENYKDLDDDFFEDLTDILIMADVGVPTAELAVNRLREQCKAENIGNPAKAREALKKILVDILWAEPMQISSPMVLLIIGVPEKAAADHFRSAAFREVPAVKNKRLIFLDADTWSRLTPAIADACAALRAKLAEQE